MNEFDVIVVGAGLSGCVLAERLASCRGSKVLILEKRDHIGGNCYDFLDENGILMNRYGAHLFHTNDEGVWEYIQRFSHWVRWEHQVVGMVDDKIVPIPVNMTTVNRLLDLHLQDTNEMKDWLLENQVRFEHISNSGEMARSRVGDLLYDKIFKEYTFKQWGKQAEELHPEVLARIPVRDNFDPRYFSDKYQALPEKGYTRFFEKLIDHPCIQVRLNQDFFEIPREELDGKTIIFTGPIDRYFRGEEKLEYRSLRFEVERFQNMNFYQSHSVVNYPQNNVPFTRIVEYKHFLNQSSPHTTIVKEYSTDDGEPYYPVLNERNLRLYERYKNLASKEKNVHFIGRLADFKYFNMDQAIRNALDYFEKYF